MKLFYLFLFLISNIFFGQEYHLFQKYKADLNGDKKKDEIRVLQKECGNGNTCRKIEVYLVENNKLKLIDENSKLLSCEDCSEYDIPFSGIEFGYKVFSVNFLLGSCDKTYYEYEFKINSKNKSVLNKIKTTEYNCNNIVNNEIITKESYFTKKDFGNKTFKETYFNY